MTTTATWSAPPTPAGGTYQYTYDSERQPDADRQPARPDRANDLRRVQQPDLDHRRRRQHHAVQLQFRRQPAQHHLPRRHPAIVHLRPARQPDRDRRCKTATRSATSTTPRVWSRRRPSPTVPARPSPTTPHGNLLTAQTLRRQRHAHRHHDADLQRRQRADLDHLSERPVLDFTYNAQGQRTQSVDQTGYTSTTPTMPGPAVRADRRLGQHDRPVHLQQPRPTGGEAQRQRHVYDLCLRRGRQPDQRGQLRRAERRSIPRSPTPTTCSTRRPP